MDPGSKRPGPPEPVRPWTPDPSDPGPRAGYCGGPEVSWTDVDCWFPDESTYPIVTLSPG